MRMAVTLSRQAGSGGLAIAEKLAEYLQSHDVADECPWALFDRNLVEKALEDHNLPKQLAKFLPEDRVSAINDMMDELFGLHPPAWTLVHKTTETILHLADLGRVILIGRAANIITSKLPNVVHVRTIGSLERRIARIRESERLSEKEARAFIRKADFARSRYVTQHFHQKIDDPALYDLVINTDRISFEHAAEIVGQMVLSRARAGHADARVAA